jgi:hypothetical protein
MASVSIVFEDKRFNLLSRPRFFYDLTAYIERQLPFMQINRITYRDEDGDIITLKNDEDLQAAYMFCDTMRCGLEIYLECTSLSKSFMTESLFQQFSLTQPIHSPSVTVYKQPLVPNEQPSTEASPYAHPPLHITSPAYSMQKDLEILPTRDQPVGIKSTEILASSTEQKALDVKPEPVTEVSSAPVVAKSENQAVPEPVSKSASEEIDLPCLVTCLKCAGRGLNKNMKKCRKCKGTGKFDAKKKRKLRRVVEIVREEMRNYLPHLLKYHQNKEENNAVHQHVACDSCGIKPILGTRYKCTICENYDFCMKCESTVPHEHVFIKIRDPLKAPKTILAAYNEDGPVMKNPYVPVLPVQPPASQPETIPIPPPQPISNPSPINQTPASIIRVPVPIKEIPAPITQVQSPMTQVQAPMTQVPAPINQFACPIPISIIPGSSIPTPFLPPNIPYPSMQHFPTQPTPAPMFQNPNHQMWINPNQATTSLAQTMTLDPNSEQGKVARLMEMGFYPDSYVRSILQQVGGDFDQALEALLVRSFK